MIRICMKFFMDENAETKISLSGAEKKKLRGQAQLLDAKVAVGKNGLTADTFKTLNAVFRKNALVKVRFAEGRAEMKAQIAEIEAATGTLCVGHVGRTAAFYRPVPAENAADA